MPLAPLHNPANLEGIGSPAGSSPTCRRSRSSTPRSTRRCPSTPTPTPSRVAWREEHRIRRYGFHGTSHAFVVPPAAELLGRPVEDAEPHRAAPRQRRVGHRDPGRPVRRHVDGLDAARGAGDGHPLRRPRPGDPAHLHRELGWSLDEIDRALNRDSGLPGLAGVNDFRELTRCARQPATRRRGWPSTSTAYRSASTSAPTTPRSARFDALVFTGGVGQHSAELRAAALDGLPRLGIALDAAAQRGRRQGRPRPSPPTAPRSPSSSSPPTRSGRSPARRSRSCARRARWKFTRTRYEQGGRQRASQDDDVRAALSARLTASGCREPRGSS